MGTPLSGKYAEVVIGSCNISEMKKWELEYGAQTETYFSRAGDGAQQTISGAESGTGSITMNLDTAATFPANTGDLVTINCYHQRSGLIQAYGSARLGKPKSSADRAGGVQEITMPFTCHGKWYGPLIR